MFEEDDGRVARLADGNGGARASMEQIGLQGPEQRGIGALRFDEAIFVVEARRGVEGAHVLPPGARPERQQRRIARIDVFPEALAGREGVDDDLGGLPDAREQLVERARDVGETEDVDGGGERLRRGRQRLDRLVQRNQTRRRPTCEAVGAEHGEPEAPLPALDLGARRIVNEPGLPGREHVTARVGVLLEDAAHATCKLHAAQVHRVGAVAGGAQVAEHRAEVGRRERGLVEQELQRHRRQRVRIRDPRSGRRRHRGREPREQLHVQVGRDALLAGDAQTHVRLEAASRHHDAHRQKGSVLRLLGADTRAKLGEQLFGTVGVDETDHGGGRPPEPTASRGDARGPASAPRRPSHPRPTWPAQPPPSARRRPRTSRNGRRSARARSPRPFRRGSRRRR